MFLVLSSTSLSALLGTLRSGVSLLFIADSVVQQVWEDTHHDDDRLNWDSNSCLQRLNPG